MAQVNTSTTAGERELSEWRRRTLPFMRWMLVVMGLFFFGASLWQLHVLEREIRHDEFDLVKAVPGLAEAELNVETRARLLLEANLVARRYNQANAIILARLWTRYLGFLTGMVLALVGAVFVLGRLRESETTLTAEGGGMKANLATSSPGLVLATLGTVLMGISLMVQFKVETRDVSIYLPVATKAVTTKPAPASFTDDDLESRPAAHGAPATPDDPFEEDTGG